MAAPFESTCEKRGGGTRFMGSTAWKKRFFVVDSVKKTLSYYTDKSAYTTHPLSPLKPALDLTKYEVVAPPDAVDKHYETHARLLTTAKEGRAELVLRYAEASARDAMFAAFVAAGAHSGHSSGASTQLAGTPAQVPPAGGAGSAPPAGGAGSATPALTLAPPAAPPAASEAPPPPPPEADAPPPPPPEADAPPPPPPVSEAPPLSEPAPPAPAADEPHPPSVPKPAPPPGAPPPPPPPPSA